MGQAPDEIRREIEETRGRMTDTVEAIEYRADVKGRAREAMTEKKESLVDRGRRAVNRVTGAMPDVGGAASTVGDATSSAASSVASAGSSVVSAVADVAPDREQMRQAVSVAQSNPLGLLVGSAAVGFVVGLALPTTRIEDEKIGEFADDLKQQAREVGQEAARHGREVVQETAQAAGQAAQRSADEHRQELTETVQQRAQDVAREA
jgi:hypothetical protein